MLDKQEVLAYIRQNEFANTRQLCEHFQVSESTVRRLLDKLDAAGLVTRIHGGAMPVSDPNKMTEFQLRNRQNKAQKIAIAREAAKLINEHDTVILMGGTTVCEMCPFIEHRRITVITNSILVLNGLRYSQNVRLVMLGGLYNYQEEEIGGLMRNQELGRMRANRMFMGSSGFDEHFGFAITNASVDMYTSCIESSLSVCVLADSSKYMSGGAVISARPDQVEYLITDNGLDTRTRGAMEESGVKVIAVAPDAV